MHGDQYHEIDVLGQKVEVQHSKHMISFPVFIQNKLHIIPNKIWKVIINFICKHIQISCHTAGNIAIIFF